MNENFEELSRDEQLRAENDILKMKLMLEHGARFPENGATPELPAELENEFLNHIMEFERQFAQRKTTTVGARLKDLSGFKLPADLDAGAYDAAWSALRTFLNENGIDLHACNKNVPSKELYRFVLEELVHHEIDDISIPGMICGFIYEEFYPEAGSGFEIRD